MEAHTYKDIRDFTEKTRKALAHEKQEEIVEFSQTIKTNTSKDLELMGLAMTGLKLKSTKGGLYGRTLFTLQHHLYPKDQTSQKQILEKCKLPECRFGAGDNVGIYPNNQYIQGKPYASGVIHRKSDYKLIISVDVKENSQDIEAQLIGNHLSVCCTINQVTYNRYDKILQQLEDTDGTHKSKNIIDTLFNYIKYPQNLDTKPLEFVDQTLNQEQKLAVTRCIATGSVYLVHGPPGTGKTKTICEVIVQAVKKGWKVLATAGSNIAVDNIVERIGKNSKVCRIGHPSRMIEQVYEYCLDNLLFKSSFNKVIKDMKRQLDQLRTKYVKTDDKGLKREMRDQMKSSRSQIRGVEEAAIKEVLDESEVICCTNTGAGERMFRYQLSKTVFDLVVIDQCAQSVQVSCWIPLLKGKRAVLAGDHLQLPPTIKSAVAQKVLGYTLFDRAMKECPVQSTLLTTQYRMNKQIMAWSSDQFYGGKLQADEKVSGHSINQISNITTNNVPIMYIDTEGCEMGENISKESSDISKSKYNLGEADIVKVICEELIDQGLKNQHIGIITPYNAQVSLIKGLLQPLQKQNQKIQISTVDGFQGRQKECIIISMVRSNPIKQVGFLADYRRMNVAVTRAKRFVCLIGDSLTVSSDKSLKSLVDYFSHNGEHRNAIEFKGNDDVRFGLGWIKYEKQEEKDKQKEKQKQMKRKTSKQLEKKKKNKNKKKQQPLINQISDVQIQIMKNTVKQQVNKSCLLQLKTVQQAEQKYIPLIEVFLSSEENQLVLENLNAFDRRIVHTIAEQFQLEHQTSADKTKLTLTKNLPPKIDQKKIEIMKELSLSTKEDFIKFTQLSAAERKQLSKIARDLKLLPQFDNQTNQLKIAKVKPKPLAVQKPKPKKKQSKKKQQQQQFDEMAFLQQYDAAQKKCHFPGTQCKAKIQHLGMRCQFCNQMFCMKHLLAQLHGCTQRAQIHARQKHRAELMKNAGETISAKQKDALRDKLQKKLKQAEKGRTQQTKKQKQKK